MILATFSDLKGKTAQLLEGNTENVTLGGELPTNQKTKVHKFIYIKDLFVTRFYWSVCVCVKTPK